MKKIEIQDTVLEGNMGDGWEEHDDAAGDYGKFLEREYGAYIKKHYPNVETDIDIDVQYRTSGSGPGINIIVTDDNGDQGLDSELEEDFRYVGQRAWERFCALA